MPPASKFLSRLLSQQILSYLHGEAEQLGAGSKRDSALGCGMWQKQFHIFALNLAKWQLKANPHSPN